MRECKLAGGKKIAAGDFYKTLTSTILLMGEGEWKYAPREEKYREEEHNASLSLEESYIILTVPRGHG